MQPGPQADPGHSGCGRRCGRDPGGHPASSSGTARTVTERVASLGVRTGLPLPLIWPAGSAGPVNRDRRPAGIGGTAASGRGKAARNPRKHDTPRTPWQDVIASTLRGTSESREGLNSTGEARRYRSLLIGSLGRQAWATESSRHHSVTICRWLASLRAAPWQLL